MPVSTSTKANAETIEAEIGLAVESLLKAQRHLRAALVFAGRDYDGNDANLRNMSGASSLVLSAAGVERVRWQNYAEAR